MMYNHGHWGIGMLAYAPIAFLLLWIDNKLWPFAVLGVIIVSFTCTLPDIDLQLKDYWFIPISHRGITHTVWFAIGIGTSLSLLTIGALLFVKSLTTVSVPITFLDAVVTALFTGILGVYGTCAHLLGDIITPAGIRPLAPVHETRWQYVLSVFGEESYAKSEHWNRFFHIVGLSALFLAFTFGSSQARTVLFDFVSGLI